MWPRCWVIRWDWFGGCASVNCSCYAGLPVLPVRCCPFAVSVPAAGRHKRISRTGIAARVVILRRAHDGLIPGQSHEEAELVAGCSGIGRQFGLLAPTAVLVGKDVGRPGIGRARILAHCSHEDFKKTI